MKKSKKRGTSPEYITVNNIEIKPFLKFSAVFSAVSSLLFSCLFGAGVLLGLPAHAAMFSTYGLWSFALVFLFYFVSVFVFSVLAVLVYNLSSRAIGGVKLKVEVD